MKRTIPLLITAIGGFVLIVAYFIPATEGWGEIAAIWFDVLAAVAFILGGGNLLRIHLQKTSDRRPGWGYSAVTVIAFLLMLFVGLLKWGSPPAVQQEFYGQLFATLSLAALPDETVATVEGRLPHREDGRWIPASVRAQFSHDPAAGTISFRGWMRGNQMDDLIAYKEELAWRCAVERLHTESQPPEELRDAAGPQIAYYSDHRSLSFRGHMTAEQRDALLAMDGGEEWAAAVRNLFERSQRVTSINVGPLPEGVTIPEALAEVVSHDAATGMLSIVGPMSARQRDILADELAPAFRGQFGVARPLDAGQRAEFIAEIESLGPSLIPSQIDALNKVLDGIWTAEILRTTLDEAGRGQEEDKTWCEMYDEEQEGATLIERKHPPGPDVLLDERQVELVDRFAAGEMSVNEFVEALDEAGQFTGRQQSTLRAFLSRNPSIGERNRDIAFRMMREGPLSDAQRDHLLADYRAAAAWRRHVGGLFIAAHDVKYPWSGEYRAQGSPFWWLYEFAFKPLTATMFAMLAFYVASAAFRAFRAKNIEATLLLGTAFIILLGRTFAGVWLTSWIPEMFAGLRIENLTVTIMQVFNTAGNRAIMIGIALGIASTSLKVLLGVDRSYLGKE